MEVNRQTNNFIGFDSEYKDAKIVSFGAPFDGTTSFRPGTRFASSVMRNESYGLETYSPYLDLDLLDTKICDAGDLEIPFGNPEKTLQIIKKFTSEIVKDNKIPLCILLQSGIL